MSYYWTNTLDKSHDFLDGYLNLFDPDPVVYRSLYSEIAETRPVIRYTFTLTGAADSKADVEIPISSFQCRYRTAEPTYLRVVIPYASAYATYISDRPNGELIVNMDLYTPGTLALIVSTEIVRVDLETVRIDEGSRNKSITLEGHKTVAFVNQSITLTDCTYKLNDDGKLMFRFASPHIYLRPNDSLTVGTDTITVGMITYYVSVNDGGWMQQQMDVQEAD
jgi:hypothetical protein